MAAEEKEQLRRQARLPWPFQLLGWIAGASGLLHLIRDLKLVEIYGLLKDWMQAYSSFVSFIKEYVFGWINFKWMNISSAEANVLVVAAVFIAAHGRAEVRYELDKGAKDAYATGIGVALVYFLIFALLPAALLPDEYGLFGAGVGLLIVLLIYFTPDDPKIEFVPRAAIVAELKGSFGLLVVALIANYALFR